MFEFNGDYKDSAQVAPWLDEFTSIYNELTAASGRGFAYNDDFLGRIPGIANTAKRGPNVGTHEESAIYLLQTLRRQIEQDEKVAALIAAGYRAIDKLSIVTRYRRVIFYSADLSDFCGEWQEWADARLLPDDDGSVRAVLPKGKRTHGHLRMGRAVLVLP